MIVIVPMIDGTGKKYVENKTIGFYLSDDNMPILDNEPMTNELYAAVIDAIKNHPDYETICTEGEPASEDDSTVAPYKRPQWEEEYYKDGNEEDRNEFRVGYSDENEDEDEDEFEFNPIDFEDDETSKRNFIIPTYKSGDTEIELPAADVDNTRIPESLNNKRFKKSLKENIKITPVFKKLKSNRKRSF